MEDYLLWDTKYTETILAQEVSKYKVFGKLPKANIISACLHAFVGIYLWPLEAGYWLWHTWYDSLYSLCFVFLTFSVQLKNKSPPISVFLTSTTIRNSFYFYIAQSRWAFFKFKFLTHVTKQKSVKQWNLYKLSSKITHIIIHKKLYNLY